MIGAAAAGALLCEVFIVRCVGISGFHGSWVRGSFVVRGSFGVDMLLGPEMIISFEAHMIWDLNIGDMPCRTRRTEKSGWDSSIHRRRTTQGSV